MRAIRRFSVRTVLPGALAPLGDLASNLRWSWHAPTRDLFASLDPAKWASVHGDPVAMLGAFTPDELDALAGDPDLVGRVEAAAADLAGYLTEPRWFQSLDADRPASIAYFSPEFGITAVLPQYSGGLGILAGDHLKSASDLGVPIVGVGLLYQVGYFKQSLSADGWQQETYPVLDPNGLPLSLLREADGSPATVTLNLPEGRTLMAHVWKAQVGRVPLLLLDSDVEANDDAARSVTDRLYGGGGEHRLQQELLLGIGGVRALRIWSRLSGAASPEVFHTNEGHAGFLGVERIREVIEADGMSFDEALEQIRAGSVFTTHTPVPAGIDRFGRDLVERYFGGPLAIPGVGTDQILHLGRESFEGGDPGVFNMALMGLRIAGRANGVSQLHGVVSRTMFEGLWPGFDAAEVPIGSITNGVHAPTWVDRSMMELAQQHVGVSLIDDAGGWERVGDIPAADLWAVRRRMRGDLVDEVRRRVRGSWLQRGASTAELGWVNDVLDPEILTIGFARRVPTYKRLTLMLRDPERLRRMLLHPRRPVQLVIAGKSHPADDSGKRLIQQMVKFADEADVRHRIVYLPNYDIAMAQSLYPGCDVWLNNPLRPFEACGTSGMKSALNGGLNLSILDGWWDEWFDGENGWAIPTADGVEDPDRRDDLEAGALYDLIESAVAPRFYDRDDSGLPSRWLEMVGHTLSTLGPKVLASRMVTDYVRELYVPAAVTSRTQTGAAAKDLAAYKAMVRSQWPFIHVDHVESTGLGDAPQVGERLSVRAVVSLGKLTADDVCVEVVHGRVSPEDTLLDPTSTAMSMAESLEDGRFRFDTEVTLRQTGPFGYTVRVLPTHAGILTPAELGLVANA